MAKEVIPTTGADAMSVEKDTTSRNRDTVLVSVPVRILNSIGRVAAF